MLTSEENPCESNLLALGRHDTISLIGEEVLSEQIDQRSPDQETKRTGELVSIVSR